MPDGPQFRYPVTAVSVVQTIVNEVSRTFVRRIVTMLALVGTAVDSTARARIGAGVDGALAIGVVVAAWVPRVAVGEEVAVVDAVGVPVAVGVADPVTVPGTVVVAGTVGDSAIAEVRVGDAVESAAVAVAGVGLAVSGRVVGEPTGVVVGMAWPAASGDEAIAAMAHTKRRKATGRRRAMVSQRDCIGASRMFVATSPPPKSVRCCI